MIILALPGRAAMGAEQCATTGSAVQWIADYCMAQIGTDDEIAASDCIDAELPHRFDDDCLAIRHYKRRMCEQAVRDSRYAGSVENCEADPAFMGRIVRNGGVGP